MSKTHSILLGGIGVVAVIILALLLSGAQETRARTTKVYPLFANNTATTSPVLLTAQGATSTSIVIPVDNAVQIDFNIFFNSTSTSAVLVWNYEFSEDRVGWHKQDTNSTSAYLTTHQSFGGTHSVAIATTTPVGGVATSTVRIHPSLASLNSSFMRVNFSLTGATSDTAYLWAEAKVSTEDVP